MRLRTHSVRLACLLLPACLGCAAAHPLRGIEAQQFGDEQRSLQRSGRDTIDLALLAQPTPCEHLVDTGDVLGIYIESILGSGQDQSVPVYHPNDRELPPSTGIPIAVRSDGTVSLPLVPPLYVRGLTIGQVEALVRRTYTIDRAVLRPGAERILVSLQKPRMYRVLVIRQEAGNGVGNVGASDEDPGNRDKRGTGRAVLLPAYRNDVLNALTLTGGLPGLDARNTIYVIRRGVTSCSTGAAPAAVPPEPSRQQASSRKRSRSSIQLVSGEQEQTAAADSASVGGFSDATPSWPPRRQTAPRGVERPIEPQPWSEAPANEAAAPLPFDASSSEPGLPEFSGVLSGQAVDPLAAHPYVLEREWASALGGGDPTIRNPRVTKIPMRLAPCEPVCFQPQDVLLADGDIVFIESREPDYFYTGGLLGTGQFELPRDYDVDILDAISVAEGRRAKMTFQYPPNKAIGGVSVLNQDVSVGASKVIVQRTLANGCIANIEVDLHKALRDPNERIMVRPGDRIILRYTCAEAFGAFFERHILEGLVVGAASGLTFGN